MHGHNHIILFDGVCNLCNGFVQFVIKNDSKHIFKFASLQSPFGQSVLQANHLSTTKFNSFIYLKNNQVLQQSTAALHVFKDLGGLYKFMFVFIMVPPFIRNGVYNLIAQNRYRWFGKKETCWLPTPELKSKFIDQLV